jgi:hypothetical protein
MCLVLLVALSVSGCGASSDGAAQSPEEAPSCEEFSACGGDVIGTWRFRSVCPTERQQAELDDAARLCESDRTTVEASFEGSMTFERGGSLLRTLTAEFQIRQSVPTSCLEEGVSCAMLQSTFAAQPAVSNVTCTTQASSCECSYRIVRASRSEETYAAADTRLTFTSPADQSQSSAAFCVRGSSLSLSDEDGVYVLTR